MGNMSYGSYKFELFISHNHANIMKEISECGQNCYEYILRIASGPIPQKLFDYHPEGSTDRARPMKR
jgi:hypothetical protein